MRRNVELRAIRFLSIVACVVVGMIGGRLAHRIFAPDMTDEAPVAPALAPADGKSHEAFSDRAPARSAPRSIRADGQIGPAPATTIAPLPPLADALRAGETPRSHAELLQRCLVLRSEEQSTPVFSGESDDEKARRIAESAARAGHEQCAGFSAAQLAQAGDWMRRAAQEGDPFAMLCYAANPGNFRADLMSPDWLNYVARWREEAPAMAERAMLAGVPEGAALLASFNDNPTTAAWEPKRGLLGDHPEQRYLYMRVFAERASRAAEQKMLPGNLAHITARIDPSRLPALDAQARALASRLPPAPASPLSESRNAGCQAIVTSVGLFP